MKVELEALPPEPKRKLTDDEYHFIYGDKEMGRVPRVGVDMILVKDGGVLLAMRDIEPFKGTWTLPGGGIKFGESIDEAVARILKGELGVGVVSKRLVGVIEHYPDGPTKHTITLAYVVEPNGEPQPKSQASELKFFTDVPENTQPFQKEFFKKHWEEIIS
jgi:ADP-ribose pyrophosphatase